MYIYIYIYKICSTFSKFCSETAHLQNYLKNVLAPVDKATGNAVVTCRRFYVLKLINELALDRDSRYDTNNNYKTYNHRRFTYC